MIKLHAGAAIDDHMLRHSIDKKTMEDRIRREIASKMVEELLNNNDFQSIIVRRENDDRFFNYGATIYETTIVVLTPAQAKEFQDLKDFKERMQWFVK